jgi:hypothetical protein
MRAGTVELQIPKLRRGSYLPGRRQEAEAQLRAALSSCERMEIHAYLPRASHELGELLLPAAEGRRLIHQARSEAADVGIAL